MGRGIKSISQKEETKVQRDLVTGWRLFYPSRNAFSRTSHSRGCPSLTLSFLGPCRALGQEQGHKDPEQMGPGAATWALTGSLQS